MRNIGLHLNVKALTVCLRLEPGTEGENAQTNPLSYVILLIQNRKGGSPGLVVKGGDL